MPHVVYAISTDQNFAQDFDPSDLEDALYFSGLTYGHTPGYEAIATDLFTLLTKLSQAGFQVRTDNLPAQTSFSIDGTDEKDFEKALIHLFRPDLAKFFEITNKISDRVFISPEIISRIRATLDNPDGDYVWLDMGSGAKLYTLNDCFRHLPAGKIYYVASITVHID